MNLNSTEDILDDLRAGRMVIIMDDENRENEGDLLMLAEKVRAEDINFMARFGRGLICLTLTQERCERLRLPLMVSRSNEAFGTNFTVSIEAAEGVTPGFPLRIVRVPCRRRWHRMRAPRMWCSLGIFFR